MSMYGVSNVVSDACGTYGVFDEELCARWMQVAAFFPMIRNYYT
jgi:alpha-glucosidase (family GH31 glycosyl hydrolase)